MEGWACVAHHGQDRPNLGGGICEAASSLELWQKRNTEDWPLLKAPFIINAEHSYLLFLMMPHFQMCLQWELPGRRSFSWTSQQHLALWVSSQGCGHRHWSNPDLSTCMTCQHEEQLPVYNIFLCIWMVLYQTLNKLKVWWGYPCL